MKKQNCWEFKHCGRQPSGANAAQLGVCPAATAASANGINSGINGGRACWAIAGTLCGGVVQGSYATKVANCMNCEFFKKVAPEEAAGYQTSRQILDRLK